MKRVVVDHYGGPEVLNPELPPMVDEVIAKAMAKDPQERYPHIGDLADAVCEAAGAT